MMTISISSIATPLLTDREGVIRVGGTRVTLDTVLAAFNNGSTPEEISWQYPSLELADIYAAITYYLRNRLEIDSYLQQRSEIRIQVREEGKKRLQSVDIRERLLSRRKKA